MKTLLLFLLAAPFWCGAQTFVLADPNLRQPVRPDDELGPDDFAKAAFPLYTSDVPALVHTLDSLARQLDDGRPMPQNMEATVSGHCTVLLWHDAVGHRPQYSGVVRVHTGTVSAPLVMGRNVSRRQLVRQLKQLSDYLRNNKTEVGL